jgi:hypothetical protein
VAYIGNQPTSVAFLTDQFSGNGSTTAFTLSAAPANTNSILVAISGVLQDPSTYSVSGTTLTFSPAPPTGTGNISVRFLGIPASGVTTTAYRTQTEFTATAGQTTFTVPSYTVGYIDVYRNGVLLGSADFTATSGTTVVLATGASAGDLVETVSFYVSSVLNAIPATAGAVVDNYILSMAGSKLTGSQSIPKAALPTGSVIQVVNATYSTETTTSSTSFVDTGLSGSITPLYSTSKILVIATINGTGKGASTQMAFKLLRGSTSLFNYESSATYTATIGSNYVGSCGVEYLDSPSTTSSTTYKVQFKSVGGGIIYAQASGAGDGSTSSITLMEIAA